MLSPRRVKHRKVHRGRRRGMSKGGTTLNFGDYGLQAETEILSLPLRLQVRKGRWQFDASLPWLRVSGDRDVVPGLGLVHGGGLLGDAPETSTRTASGAGDLDLAARYAIDTGSKLGVAIGARAKVAIADADRGLGTGANDYGLSADVYRSFGATQVFASVAQTWFGASPLIDVDSGQRASAGFSRAAGRGNWGLRYEQRSAVSARLEGRRDATVFLSVPTTQAGSLRVHATRGLSEGSPDWGIGVELAVDAGG